MGRARAPERGDPRHASWLVLDLVDSSAQTPPGEAFAPLSQNVAGITTLVGGRPRHCGDESVATVASTARAGAARLEQAAAALCSEVDVIVYGDQRLMGAGGADRVWQALARFDCGDVALMAAVPIADSLRLVDGRGRLRGCVERTGLFVPTGPHVLRRAVIPELARVSVRGGGDGSVEAGLLRSPWPVRVAHLPAASPPAEQPSAADAPLT